MTGEKYLRVRVVASFLSCSKDYVYALIRNGNLDAVNLGERQTRIPEKSLIEFLNDKKIRPADAMGEYENE